MGRSTRDAVCPISTRRFASAYGSGLINTPFTRAKTAAVAQDADYDPRCREANPIAHHLRHHIAPARPEREPDAELAAPLPDGVGQEPVDADGGEQQRGSGEAA